MTDFSVKRSLIYCASQNLTDFNLECNDHYLISYKINRICKIELCYKYLILLPNDFDRLGAITIYLHF